MVSISQTTKGMLSLHLVVGIVVVLTSTVLETSFCAAYPHHLQLQKHQKQQQEFAPYKSPSVYDDDDGKADIDQEFVDAAAVMLGDEPHMEFPAEKKEMLNKVMAALLHVNPDDMKSFVEDNVQDPFVKKAILTKKVNVCHFKLCNLGRRRRR